MPTCVENIPISEVVVASPARSPGGLSVTVGDPRRDTDWDSSVSERSRYNAFYASAWTRILCDTYGYEPLYLAAYTAGKAVGHLPLMEVDSWLTGKRGVSLPFADECGPLGVDGQIDQVLIERALQLGHDRNWRSFECRGCFSSGSFDVPTTNFFGHQLDLRVGAESLFAGFDGSVRRAIRKAVKEGVEVDISNSISSLRDYYRLHCLTRKRHGVPPQPWRFFESIHRHLISRDMGFVAVARSSGHDVAGAVYLRSGRRCVFKYGASDVRFQHLRANNLVMWKAIKSLIGKGCETLDLGRTTEENSGLRRFKAGWRSREYRLSYLKYDFTRGRFVTSRPGRGQWREVLFRKLPVPLARFVGAQLYRHYA